MLKIIIAVLFGLLLTGCDPIKIVANDCLKVYRLKVYNTSLIDTSDWKVSSYNILESRIKRRAKEQELAQENPGYKRKRIDPESGHGHYDIISVRIRAKNSFGDYVFDTIVCAVDDEKKLDLDETQIYLTTQKLSRS